MSCSCGKRAPGPPGCPGFPPTSFFLVLKFVPLPCSPASHLSPVSFDLSTVTSLDARPEGPSPFPQASQAGGMKPKSLSMDFKVVGDLPAPHPVTPDPPASWISLSPPPTRCLSLPTLARWTHSQAIKANESPTFLFLDDFARSVAPCSLDTTSLFSHYLLNMANSYASLKTPLRCHLLQEALTDAPGWAVCPRGALCMSPAQHTAHGIIRV